MIRQSLPDFALEVLDTGLFVAMLAWLTVLPSIGLLWLVGVLS